MGDDPDPITEVRGADGRCRNAVPLRVIPERGQVPENLAERSAIVDSQEVSDVLHEDEAGSKLANGSRELGPEPTIV
jgi:hypothetical protein